jgi:excinuclease ABC subunit C
VFEQGVPQKKHYRRFNIRSVSGQDDFASMEEVLRRRFRRWSAAKEEITLGKKVDQAFAMLPDLLIVDGGKGQLGRAVEVLEDFELMDKVAVAGLAKQNEELYLPGRSRPVILARRSQGLYLVQRIRDEAHRFAITAHRRRRTKLGLASRLEAVPGVGPARRQSLLKHFGTIEAIRQAELGELMSVPGITEQIAAALKDELD